MTDRVADLNGWFEIPRNPLAKAGVFAYTAKAIQAPGWEANPAQIYQVYRPEEELASPETMDSLRLLPWVEGHAMLGDPTYQDGLTPPEQKGVHGVIGEQISYDRDSRTLYGNIKLWSTSLADAIDAGKKELSLGWRCVYEFCNGNFEGQPYQAIQRTLRGNHNASVDLGRMGPDVAVLDHFSFTLDAGEIISMSVAPIKVKRADRIAKAFGLKDRAAVAAYVAALDAEDDAPAEGSGEGDMTLADVSAMLKTIAPQVQGLVTALASLSAPPADETDDMEPMLDGDGAPVMDEAGKPKMQKKVAPTIGQKPAAGIAATDAAEFRTRLTAIETALPAAPTFKSIMAEVGQRDALASKLSEFVGTFDASEKSLIEVAKYGVEKLALPGVVAGTEIAAVNAYLHNRPAPRSQAGFALDSAVAVPSAKKSVVDYFDNKTAAA